MRTLNGMIFGLLVVGVGSCAPDEMSDRSAVTPFGPNLVDKEALTLYVDTLMDSVIFENLGATSVQCAVDPPLPIGVELILVEGACVIQGKPSQISAATLYNITATSANSLNSTAEIEINVAERNELDPPKFQAIDALELTINEASSPLIINNSGGTVIECQIEPSLPAGLSLSVASSSCRISGTPTALQSSATYVLSGVTALTKRGSLNIEISVVPKTLRCDSNWLKIPAYSDGQVSAAEFCVMKYEAKLFANNSLVVDGDVDSTLPNVDYSVAGVYQARSVPEGQPWVRIKRRETSDALDAERACSNLGEGYALINNSQWQVLARKIELAESSANVRLNWSNSSTNGTNFLTRGHTDSSPLASLAASSNDSDGCVGTGNTSCMDNTHADFSQRRTFNLSHDQVIWDFAGNVWEWVAENSGFSYGTNSQVALITSSYGNECTNASSCMLGFPKVVFGPFGDYSAKNASPFGNLGIGWIGAGSGGIVRGGRWNSTGNGGIFATNQGITSNFVQDGYGFRCVRTLIQP